MEIRADYVTACQSGDRSSSVYHQKRLDRVINGESFLDFTDDAGFMLHVIPEAVFSTDEAYRVDLGNVGRETPPVLENPKRGTGRANSLDGTASGIAGLLSQRDEEGDLSVGRYVHTAVNGIIEAVSGKIAFSKQQSERKKTIGSTWEAMVVSGVRSYIEFLDSEGMSGPFTVHLSLFNMQDVAFDYESRSFPGEMQRFTSKRIDPFPVSVTGIDTDTEMRNRLAPLLNSVWRAAGYTYTPTIDEDGEWELGSDS
jgi:hypothetical protein